MNDEKEHELLTEAEWSRRQAVRECRTYGHSWNILETLVAPVALRCKRNCGHPGYLIVPKGSKS